MIRTGGFGLCLVLVVDYKLLGFDLLLGFDAIKKLGGVCVTCNGTVSFPQLDRPMCAAISINKPDFNARYDKNRMIWVVSRKWSGDQSPATLKNRLTEYLALKQL